MKTLKNYCNKNKMLRRCTRLLCNKANNEVTKMSTEAELAVLRYKVKQFEQQQQDKSLFKSLLIVGSSCLGFITFPIWFGEIKEWRANERKKDREFLLKELRRNR